MRKGVLLDLILTNKENCSEMQGQHGLQQPRKAGVQERERREQGKQQDHNPGLQKNNLWPVQGLAWKNPVGGGHGE